MTASPAARSAEITTFGKPATASRPSRRSTEARRPRGASSTLLTAAVALIALGGTIAALVAARPDGGPTRSRDLTAAAFSTPIGGEHPPLIKHVASFWVDPDQFPEGVTAPLQATIFDWRIDPGKTATVAGSSGDAIGLAFDVVLSGVYRGTLQNRSHVIRADLFGGSSVEYVEVGETVELGRGDVIVSRYRSAQTIENPLTEMTLWFKRITLTSNGVPPSSTDASPYEAYVILEDQGRLPDHFRIDDDSFDLLFHLDAVQWWDDQPWPNPERPWEDVITRLPVEAEADFYAWRLSVRYAPRG